MSRLHRAVLGYRPHRSARLAAVAAVVVSGMLAAPAGAAPKQIKKSFDVLIPVPLRGYLSMSEPVQCAPGGPGSFGSSHWEPFRAPAAGTLQVEVTGFAGDWDVVLFVAGDRVAEGGPTRTPTQMSDGSVVERLTYRFTKRGEGEIKICNFAGSPSGKGKYVFTYAR